MFGAVVSVYVDVLSISCAIWSATARLRYLLRHLSRPPPPGSFHVDLYYLHSFYCEVRQQLPTSQVAYLHSFAAQSQLYPYLDLIKLPQALYA